MTPVLHFSSSSNRTVHVAKLTYGDKTLFRALFRGVVMSSFKRSPVPNCQALTESQQFDLVERAVARARALAKSSSDTTKLETCSNCASAAPVDGAPERVFCILWKVSCSHTGNCYKFERVAAAAPLRRLFPARSPSPATFTLTTTATSSLTRDSLPTGAHSLRRKSGRRGARPRPVGS